MPFLFYAFVCVLILTIVPLIFLKYKKFALVFTIIVGCLFPIFMEPIGWSWFAYAKITSLVYPVIILTWLNDRVIYYKEKPIFLFTLSLYAMSFFLALNCVEVAISELLFGNLVNSICAFLLTLMIPLKFSISEKNNIVGINDMGWIIGGSLCIAYFYFFNPEFEQLDFPALAVVVLSLIIMVIKNDAHYWITYRLYAVYLIALIKSFFPNIIFYVYPVFLHPTNRLSYKGTGLEYIWISLTVATVSYMVFKRIQRMVNRQRTS